MPLAVVLAILAAVPLALRLARRRPRLVVGGLACGAVLALVVDDAVYRGLYPAAHAALRLAALGAVAAAAGRAGLRPRSPAVGAAVLASGALALGAHVAEWMPAGPPEARALVLWEAPIASTFLAPLASPPEESAPDADFIRQLLDDGRIGPEPLDAAFPGRRDWSVILVTCDALRADAVGLSGPEKPHTPALAALGRESVVYLNAYSTYSATIESMRSVFTARYPESGPTPNAPGGRAPTLAARLAASGRETKALVSFIRPVFDDAPELRDGFSTWERHDEDARAVSDRGIAWLKADEGRPRFLWLHYFDAHFPYRAHGKKSGSTQLLYAGEVGYVDEHLGRFLAALRASPMNDRTLVVFHADHGTDFGEHGGIGHTAMLHDEAIRVPLMIRAPGLRPRRIDRAVDLSCVSPTVTELLDLPASRFSQGRSLSRDLLPEEQGHPALPDFAFSRFRTSQYFGHSADMIVHRGWKVIQNLGTGLPRVFDLYEDPGERRDLAGSRPERTRALLASLASVRRLARTEDRGRELADASGPRPGADRLGARLFRATRLDAGSIEALWTEDFPVAPPDERIEALRWAATAGPRARLPGPSLEAALADDDADLRRAALFAAPGALIARHREDADAGVAALARALAPDVAPPDALPAVVSAPWMAAARRADPGTDVSQVIDHVLAQGILPPALDVRIRRERRRLEDDGTILARYWSAFRIAVHREEPLVVLEELEGRPPEDALPILRAFCGHTAPFVRARVVEILRAMGREDVLPALSEGQRAVSEIRELRFRASLVPEVFAEATERARRAARSAGFVDWGLALEIAHLPRYEDGDPFEVRRREVLARVLREDFPPGAPRAELVASAIERALDSRLPEITLGFGKAAPTWRAGERGWILVEIRNAAAAGALHTDLDPRDLVLASAVQRDARQPLETAPRELAGPPPEGFGPGESRLVAIPLPSFPSEWKRPIVHVGLFFRDTPLATATMVLEIPPDGGPARIAR
ncbi:MAG: sulfatase [Planctomycetota bacterium]